MKYWIYPRTQRIKTSKRYGLRCEILVWLCYKLDNHCQIVSPKYHVSCMRFHGIFSYINCRLAIGRTQPAYIRYGYYLTHWGRVTHIWYTIPVRKQTVIRKHLTTYLLSQIIDKYINRTSINYVFVCSGDFKAAFDSILRQALFYKLAKLSIGGNFLRTIQSMYSNVQYSVKLKVESPCPLHQPLVWNKALYLVPYD